MAEPVFAGLGTRMPVPGLVNIVEKGAGETLQGIVLLIGLGSLFGGILEISGGAQSAGSVLVANILHVDLGVMIAVGVPVGILSLLFAGILWSKFIGSVLSGFLY